MLQPRSDCDAGAYRCRGAQGRSIQGIGLKADIVVPLPKDEEVANALALHEADFFGSFKNPGSIPNGGVAKPANPAPTQAGSNFEHPTKPALIATAQDAQLKAALDYLRNTAQRNNAAQPG